MIVVDKVLGLSTVQDLGRPGRLHEGLAAGGALVPEWLVRANRAIGNPDGAPAIEVFGKLVLSIDGQSQTIESEPRRVAYVAIPGGVAAPLILGGRGTQLTAGIGAPLRAGDRIERAGEPIERPGAERVDAGGDWLAGVDDRDGPGALDGFDVDFDAPIRLIPGPEQIPGGIELLRSAEYRILPASDRVGTRLDGPAILGDRGRAVSRPLACGAIEVPPDGKPIVMGREHPATGGYPVIAVVATADLGRLFAHRLGSTVRFV